MAKEQVPVLKQIGVEVLDDLLFRDRVEIDQHVTAQNDVHSLYEQHAGVIEQVEPGEGHNRLYLGFDPQLVSMNDEILVAVKRLKVTGAVVAIIPCFGVGDGAFIQVSGNDLDAPFFKLRCLLFHQNHCKGVGFFSGGTAGTPNSQLPQRDLGLGLNDAGQDGFPNGFNLGAIAEKTGFSDCDFVQQAD